MRRIGDSSRLLRRLLNRYRDWSKSTRRTAAKQDPLLRLRGSGKQLWKAEHADEYVRRLREG